MTETAPHFEEKDKISEEMAVAATLELQFHVLDLLIGFGEEDLDAKYHDDKDKAEFTTRLWSDSGFSALYRDIFIESEVGGGIIKEFAKAKSDLEKEGIASRALNELIRLKQELSKEDRQAA